MSAMVKNNVAEGAVLRLSSNLNRPLAGRASVGLMVLSMVISLVVGSGFWSLSLYYLTLASQCMLLAFVLLLALRLSKPPSSSDIFQTTVTIGSIIDADGRQSRRRVPFSKDGSGTRDAGSDCRTQRSGGTAEDWPLMQVSLSPRSSASTASSTTGSDISAGGSSGSGEDDYPPAKTRRRHRPASRGDRLSPARPRCGRENSSSRRRWTRQASLQRGQV
ncbi:hypothetical protein FOZ63_025704 [Perkinsus olseni]|uniref:Uncharacterized protein n=1 Tax=Perkinsus olseni TaxID=32597 RepID=A0A7J6U796_PEROL|nr:hypothetical protein FOZ63_025704 [Perkinsus olseni]